MRSRLGWMDLLAWGALVGGSLGWLISAGPPRATVPVGVAFPAGLAGFAVGVVVDVDLLGDALIDGNPSRLLTSALIGAGIGWCIGAVAGSALARSSAAPTKGAARTLRGLGLAALLLGFVAARFETSLVGPGGLSNRYLPSLQVATMVDVALLALTLLIAAGTARTTAPREPAGSGLEGRWTRWLDRSGKVFGCIIPTAVLIFALQTEAAVETSIQRRANDRTAYSLASAASEYMNEKGVYPADLETLLASGAKIATGSFVNFAGAVPGGFCVRVGTDIGREYGGPPYSTALVHPRPPRAHAWTDLEGWSGDSCRSGAGMVES